MRPYTREDPLDLRGKTNQELFDQAYRGLASQGFRQSRGSKTACFYRGPSGRRCAIGWLTGRGRRLQEGFSVGAFLFAGQVVADADAESFLVDLQAAHDTADSIGVKRQVEDVATRYHLTIPGHENESETSRAE